MKMTCKSILHVLPEGNNSLRIRLFPDNRQYINVKGKDQLGGGGGCQQLIMGVGKSSFVGSMCCNQEFTKKKQILYTKHSQQLKLDFVHLMLFDDRTEIDLLIMM